MQKRKENRRHGCLLVVEQCIGCHLPHTDSLLLQDIWTELIAGILIAWRLLIAISSPFLCSSAFAKSATTQQCSFHREDKILGLQKGRAGEKKRNKEQEGQGTRIILSIEVCHFENLPNQTSERWEQFLLLLFLTGYSQALCLPL